MPKTSTHLHNTRYASKDNLYKTCFRTNTGKRAISATAVDLWQELTPDFKRHLRIYLKAWRSYIWSTVRMSRRFINGKGLSVFFPYKEEKYTILTIWNTDGTINLVFSFLNVWKEMGLSIFPIYSNLVYCVIILGAVYKIKCCDCQASYIGETGRNLSTRLTEHKRATRDGDVNNHIAEHLLKTKHQIDWDCDMYNVFYRLLPTSYFRKLVY